MVTMPKYLRPVIHDRWRVFTLFLFPLATARIAALVIQGFIYSVPLILVVVDFILDVQSKERP